jgi:hypothetical protein
MMAASAYPDESLPGQAQGQSLRSLLAHFAARRPGPSFVERLSASDGRSGSSPGNSLWNAHVLRPVARYRYDRNDRNSLTVERKTRKKESRLSAKRAKWTES